MRMLVRPLLAISLGAASPACAAAGQTLAVERVSEVRLAVSDGAEPRIDAAFFDAEGRLRLDVRRVHEQETGDCDTAAGRQGRDGRTLYSRSTRLVVPRVDERRCPGPEGAGLAKALVGLDSSGRVAWTRPLVHRSGPREIEQWLIGATPQGLVLSSLEVWSPATGETLVPAPSHPAGAGGGTIPDHHFSTSAVYLPDRQVWLASEADVTLLRREGGIYRIDGRKGGKEKELLVPVSASAFGTYDRVESMGSMRDQRFVLLGGRSSSRGPSSVSVAVLDADAGQVVFEERHGRGRSCSAPQVVAGPDGQFGFAYRDDSAGQHVLVHYRLR